eukprot:8694941-Alexandrium_andersonii.AAC.1
MHRGPRSAWWKQHARISPATGEPEPLTRRNAQGFPARRGHPGAVEATVELGGRSWLGNLWGESQTDVAQHECVKVSLAR